MSRKRYFSVRQFEQKSIKIDEELYTFIKTFAHDTDLTIPEAVYLLIGPGIAFAHGLDPIKPFEMIGDALAPKTL